MDLTNCKLGITCERLCDVEVAGRLMSSNRDFVRLICGTVEIASLGDWRRSISRL